MLVISIIQTIKTNPGNIPEDKEWDMLTDSMAESNTSSDDGESGFSSSDGLTPNIDGATTELRIKNIE